MRRLPFRRVSVLLAFAMSASGLARADAEPEKVPEPSAEAEAHVAHGLELRRQRRDEEALVEFRAGYALQRSGRVLAQIALAEDAVGLWVEAERDLEEVLSERGNAWVEKRRGALVEELRVVRMHLADLALEVVPAGAEVWLNGAEARRRPDTGAFRVVSGRVLIEVKAPGFETARRVLELPPGARSRETIALAEAPPARSPSAIVVPSPAGASRPMPAAAPDMHTQMSVPRILAFTSFALAGAAVAIGTVGAVERTVRRNEYNDNRRCDQGGVPRSVQCAGVADEFARFTTVMTSGYVTAGAAALMGGVLAFAFPGQVRIEAAPRGTAGWMVGAEGEF